MSLGPCKLQPEEPDTLGCLYCRSRRIYHPQHSFGFRRGGEYRWEFLFSVIPKIHKYVEDWSLLPGVKVIDKSYEDSTYADAALHMYNEKEGRNFELVKIGPYGTALLTICSICHINFEAKDRDDPDSPVQTFFAEVISRHPIIFTGFCKCLGESNSLPVNMCGCTFCTSPVHHPPVPGYLTGRETYPDCL